MRSGYTRLDIPYTSYTTRRCRQSTFGPCSGCRTAATGRGKNTAHATDTANEQPQVAGPAKKMFSTRPVDVTGTCQNFHVTCLLPLGAVPSFSLPGTCSNDRQLSRLLKVAWTAVLKWLFPPLFGAETLGIVLVGIGPCGVLGRSLSRGVHPVTLVTFLHVCPPDDRLNRPGFARRCMSVWWPHSPCGHWFLLT